MSFFLSSFLGHVFLLIKYLRLPSQEPYLPFQFGADINANVPFQNGAGVNVNFPFQIGYEINLNIPWAKLEEGF